MVAATKARSMDEVRKDGRTDAYFKLIVVKLFRRTRSGKKKKPNWSCELSLSSNIEFTVNDLREAALTMAFFFF